MGIQLREEALAGHSFETIESSLLGFPVVCPRRKTSDDLSGAV